MARPKTVVPPRRPQQDDDEEGALPTPTVEQQRPGGGENRRRTQRVLLRIPAKIHVALEGTTTTLDATTLSVNANGALVVMKRGLTVNTRLVFEHGNTKERVTCKVVRPSLGMPDGYHVAVEFDSPEPDFWRITFPPSDWSPSDL